MPRSREEVPAAGGEREGRSVLRQEFKALPPSWGGVDEGGSSGERFLSIVVWLWW